MFFYRGDPRLGVNQNYDRMPYSLQLSKIPSTKTITNTVEAETLRDINKNDHSTDGSGSVGDVKNIEQVPNVGDT